MKKIVVIGVAGMLLAACGNDNSQSDSSSSQSLEENTALTAIKISTKAEQESKPVIVLTILQKNVNQLLPQR